MNKTILYIVEGENRDYKFVNNMTDVFFRGKYKTKIINVPAKQNIYMLYEILKEDGFESDLIELIRDKVPGAREKLEGISRQDVDEIYMFFDYDVHQDNCHSEDDVLSILLETFDNETENGKLYISYPMVEALYDFKDNTCESFTGCFVNADVGKEYKGLAGGNNNSNASGLLAYNEWKAILGIFSLRVACLLGIQEMSFDIYRNQVTPYSIYNCEKNIYESEKWIFVLSALPEFLLDYFRVDFWKSHTSKRKKVKCSAKSCGRA